MIELTAEDKLPMREAQLTCTSLALQLSQLQTQHKDLSAVYEGEKTKAIKIFDDLKTKAGCDLDERTLEPRAAEPQSIQARKR